MNLTKFANNYTVMNPEEHRLRHVKLHQALDELFADYIKHHPDQREYLTMPLRQFIEWSHFQTMFPDDAADDE